MIQRIAVLGFIVLLAGAMPGPAQEQSPPTASVTARLIEAREEGPEKTDAALSDIEKKLKRSFNYKQFLLVGKGGKTIKQKEPARIALPKGMALETELLGISDGRIQLSLKWTRKEGKSTKTLFNTTVRLQPNHAVVLGGPSANGGGVLILAVTAR